MCKQRDKTSSYKSKFVYVNIHKITSELGAGGVELLNQKLIQFQTSES